LIKTENVTFEWKETRDTIGRFDNYLLKLRILGFSIFTIFFTTIVGIAGIKKEIDTFTPETILFAILILTLFVLSIYILDRYYERMLLVAVYRASYLEVHRLEGFRIGLTTEIEFQKEQLSNKINKYNFLKASHMVNFVYGLIFITMWIQYFILTKKIEQSFFYNLVLFSIIVVVTLLMIAAHMLLSEPGALIGKRSEIVNSPTIMSKEEIKYSIKKITYHVLDWLKRNDTNELHIVSIVSGARPFTEKLIKELEIYNIKIFLHPIHIKATNNSEHLEKYKHIYGHINNEINNKNVLIVDDLLDSGKTILKVKNILKDYSINSIKVAVLINKYYDKHVNADFIGLNLGLKKDELEKNGIKDYWLFGFGMDLNGQYRDIEHIGWIKKTIQT